MLTSFFICWVGGFEIYMLTDIFYMSCRIQSISNNSKNLSYMSSLILCWSSCRDNDQQAPVGGVVGSPLQVLFLLWHFSDIFTETWHAFDKWLTRLVIKREANCAIHSWCFTHILKCHSTKLPFSAKLKCLFALQLKNAFIHLLFSRDCLIGFTHKHLQTAMTRKQCGSPFSSFCLQLWKKNSVFNSPLLAQRGIKPSSSNPSWWALHLFKQCSGPQSAKQSRCQHWDESPLNSEGFRFQGDVLFLGSQGEGWQGECEDVRTGTKSHFWAQIYAGKLLRNGFLGIMRMFIQRELIYSSSHTEDL